MSYEWWQEYDRIPSSSVPVCGPGGPAGDANSAGEIWVVAHVTQCPGPHTHTPAVHATQKRPIPCHMNVGKSITTSHAPTVPARGPPEPAGDPNPASKIGASGTRHAMLWSPHAHSRSACNTNETNTMPNECWHEHDCIPCPDRTRERPARAGRRPEPRRQNWRQWHTARNALAPPHTLPQCM